PFTINFATSTRPDTRISYGPGFAATTTKRISEVDALINSTTVRKYLLGYGTGNNGYRSLLTNLQQLGYDENNIVTTLPTSTFSYASASTQFYAPNGSPTVQNQAYVMADTLGQGVNEPVTMYKYDVDGTLHTKSSACGTVSAPDYWASNPPSTYSPVER